MIDPAFPGFGNDTTATVTVALTAAHGAVPGTVYVYVPVASVPGVNVPELAPPAGAVHVPPTSGVPPSAEKRSVEGLEMHKVTAPSDPAFGGTFCVIATVAWSLAQGAIAVTV